MNREESGKWAALLQAQADGKQLEYNAGDGFWEPKILSADSFYNRLVDLWRIAPELPPKPSQDQINRDVHSLAQQLECSDEFRNPQLGERAWFGASRGVETIHLDIQTKEPRWILRKRAPAVKPWTIDTVPMPLVVRSKTGGDIATVFAADNTSVSLYGWSAMTYAALLEKFTQRDGSPCGEVST